MFLLQPLDHVSGNPVYFVQGSGASGYHNILTRYPPVNFDTYITLSIYIKTGTNRYAQISVGGNTIFGNFDMELDVLGTKHAFVKPSITQRGVAGADAR